jgi:hypothetical protein
MVALKFLPEGFSNDRASLEPFSAYGFFRLLSRMNSSSALWSSQFL